MCLVSHRGSFLRWWGGTVVILLNMGYYTLYEESYILEIQIEN